MRTSPYLFFDGDVPLAGHIHRAGGDLLDRQPAVIVTGSWLTVKEQMADLYARALAERGYTAVTFDFTGFGGSGGTPRQAEIPARKITNIVSVATQVARLSFVRPGAVGYLAVCASAQYALAALGLSAASSVSTPALFVHSDDCVLPGNVKMVADRLAGPKEVVWADGTQTDFYDQPAQVSLAVDAVDEHFRRTLPS